MSERTTTTRRYQPQPVPCHYCNASKQRGEFTINIAGYVSCWDCYHDTDWRSKRGG